jgi:hypothetical protein
MGFPKDYDDSKYAGRRQKETCQGKDLKGKPCLNKAVKGRSLCGHCIDRAAAEEQKTREAHQAEKK